MGNTAVTEEMASTDDLEELYELNGSESEPEDDDEDDEDEDDDEEGIQPEDMPHP